MAKKTKCPNGHDSGFELEVEHPRGATVPLRFVRCAECGTVVGITDIKALGKNLEEIGLNLKKLMAAQNLGWESIE